MGFIILFDVNTIFSLGAYYRHKRHPEKRNDTEKKADFYYLCHAKKPPPMIVKVRFSHLLLSLVSICLLFFSNCTKDEELPSVDTLPVTGITDTLAEGGGRITHSGSGPVASRGLVWDTVSAPSRDRHSGITAEGEGSGTFHSLMVGLLPGTDYYVRAYAVNEVGTAYGSELTFTTDSISPGLPVVTTAAPSDVTATEATTGGEVVSAGESEVTARGVCWSTAPQPDLAGNHTVDSAGTGPFTTFLSGLDPATTYYVRAYATNSQGTAYGSQQSFTTDSMSDVPVVTTKPVTDITAGSAHSGGEVVSEGLSAVTERGVCWSTSPLPDLSDSYSQDGTGAGTFTSQMTRLIPDTTYYVRAYAVNDQGTAYGTEISFNTQALATDQVYNATTGRVWMDRNLGADQVATATNDASAYGDLYQWGREKDGHQKRTSDTTITISDSDTPGHNQFIVNPNAPMDWRYPQNDNLWQGVDGINNPCPPGFRVPTASEWHSEVQSWSSNDNNGAMQSVLKLPAGGHRYQNSGSIGNVGTYGNYWSSTTDGTNARLLYFYPINATTISFSRARGMSIRCIMD